MSRKKKNNHKDREGVVYSTNPDFEFSLNIPSEEETLPNQQQDLRVSLDTKLKAGKKATVIKGFVGTAFDLKTLEKKLKAKCGVGGSSKDGEIIIQGDVVAKIMDILKDDGYQVKRSGG